MNLSRRSIRRRSPLSILGGRRVETVSGPLNSGARARRGAEPEPKWNVELNQPRSNIHYRVDDRYNYFTDDVGRPVVVEGELTLLSHPAQTKRRRNKTEQIRSGQGNGRLKADQGGHLIATMFYGMGEALNLVPMDGRLNGPGPGGLRSWWDLEQQWSEQLRSGRRVVVRMHVQYPDSRARPSRISVWHKTDNGPVKRVAFTNDPVTIAAGTISTPKPDWRPSRGQRHPSPNGLAL